MSLPFIDADAAISAASAVMAPGPDLDRADIDELVEGLRSALSASVEPVAEVTRLGVDADGPMRVVDRATWLKANVDMALTMLGEASPTGLPAPVRLRDKIAGRANGAQLGLVLAALGSRILGQYLPFAGEPHLLVVAPNVSKIERELKVNPADFRLWVCLHEQTHRLQFASAPWLRGHLVGQLQTMLADDDADTSRKGRPHNLLEALTTPAQQAVFKDVTATMSLLEGYADDMMDRVGPEVVPTVATIRSKFEARRHKGGWTKVLNKALGMDLKLAQYRDGAQFCRAVIDKVGVDGLNAVYTSPEHLPRGDEIHDPAAWVQRIHG